MKVLQQVCVCVTAQIPLYTHLIVFFYNQRLDIGDIVGHSGCNDFSFSVPDNKIENGENDEITKNNNVRAQLKWWAVEHHITHHALKDLLKILNERLGAGDSILPV